MNINEKNTSIQITEKFVVQLTTFNREDRIYFTNNTSTFIALSKGFLETENSKISGVVGACVNKNFSVAGNGFAVSCPGVKFNLDTSVSLESTGHGELSYIDGCSNSLIVGPARSGDPCLNYLYFPPGIKQTFHTHPSFRIGLVVSGSGTAHVGDKTLELKEGESFFLPRYVNHRFSTDNNHMSILVFHPDSDDGPLDEHNPMKTRTYIQPW